MNVHYHRNFVSLLLRITSLHTSNIIFSRNYFTVTNAPEQLETKMCHAKEKKLKKADDSLDSFIDKLVQERFHANDSRNIETWTKKFLSTLNINDSSFSSMETKEENTNISQLHLLKQYLQNCVHEESLIDHQTCLVLLHIFANNGSKESIYILKDLSSKYNEEEYIKEGCYDHFLGEAIWRSGNIEQAVKLFWDVYENNFILRHKIKKMLNVLMAESIREKGEAVLIFLIKFSEKFINNYNDYTLLLCIWEVCFLSKWFSDNELASSLLEEYPELRNYLSLHVLYLSSSSLAVHKLDVVQRLFEVLLKYDMKKEYGMVLRSLFDYACAQRNITACSAISESAQQLDVTLTEAQQAKFVLIFSKHALVAIKKKETPKFLFRF